MLKAFQSIPRYQLIQSATPLWPLGNYSEQFGRQLYIKRDDLNGVGAGGNKVRKLEYLLHEAIQQGYRSVVTGGGLQSNHAAATALCALRAGLKPYLALTESVPIKTTHYEHGANLVLDDVSGAQIKRFPAGSSTNECIRQYADEIEQTTSHKPFEIVMGGSSALGALGYVRAALELAEQFSSLSEQPESLVHASGSAGTQAGLIVGFALAGVDVRVLGASVLHETSTLHDNVKQLCEDIADMLDMPARDWSQLIHINDGYIGKGYGLASVSTWNTIHTAISNESIVFDPCYTGKAFNCFVDLLKKDADILGNSSVFLHTGGLGGMFAYKEQII